MNYFWSGYQASLVWFQAVLLLIALSNLWAWRKLGNCFRPDSLPRVSVVIPVRDEEANISPCVRSLLAQQCLDYEVLVLDDDSHDGTTRVSAALATEDRRLRVLKGQPLPPGWLGKHWACHQLAQVANSEFLLFVDADTRHEAKSLRCAMAVLLSDKADLVSVFPRQQVGSWAERLVVPIMQWSLFSFLPLALAYRLPVAALSSASGQFMLFRRQAYEDVGGHGAVRKDAVDDVALARRIKARGLRWRLLDGGEHVRCRMYHNFAEAHKGLSKNLFALFGRNVPRSLFVWLWLLVVFVEPLLVLALGLLVRPMTSANLAMAGLAIVLSLLLWGLSHWRFGFPLYLTLLYPLSVVLTVVIAMHSMFVSLFGRATWKGRKI